MPTGALVEHGLLDHLVRPQQECLRIVSPSALAVFRLMTSSSADWVRSGPGPTTRTSPSSPVAYREPDKFFPRAVQRAQDALREAGRDDEAAPLDGVPWHGLRYTWASRLTMSGVDPRTLQTLGGWRSLSMVEQRYSHLSPDHLRSAVEKLVAPTLRLEATASPVSQSEARPEPSRAPELDSNLTRLQDEASRAS